MEARIRLSAKNLNRKHMVISQASDYYDYSFQKQKQQPKLLDSVKKQKLDFEAFAEGYADDDTNIFASGLINIDEIYDETDKIKQENKFLMSKLMDHESERSKIASLNAEIQNAAKKNKELMIESKQLSKSFMLDRDDLAINPSMNTNIITMNKYERCLHKIQTQFKILQEEIKEREAIKEMPIEDTENIRNEIDQMIYKEQQETKLLRIKYESILDGLDKEIEKLEGWIEEK